MSHKKVWFVGEDGRLDMSKLIAGFQQFFREQSDSWVQKFDYHEAGPQLLLQAYLQRIVNAHGRINREYGLGRKRTDLFVEWPLEKDNWTGDVQRIVLELKIQRKGQSQEAVVEKALSQTTGYADQCGADEAHLLVFNRNGDVTWEDRIFGPLTKTQDGRTVSVWGM